jgi:hypothetical protein
MLAPVVVHVDLADGRGDELLKCGGDGPGRARDREDGAVVAGVARPVEQVDAWHGRHGGREAVDDVEPAPLRHVRDGFDQPVGQVVRDRAHRGPSCHAAPAARGRRRDSGPAGTRRSALPFTFD